MCGLAGYLEGGRRAPRAPAEMRRRAGAMAAALAHRGPDGAGTWVDAPAGIAIGHRRLAVLDRTETGAQPMVSADGRWVLAFNGEIYNHGELRARLGARGVALRGRSDTEALLEACAAWGVEPALEAARGMLAVALWDRRERVLHLAVDRLGKKPLYHGPCGEAYLFGSELKALHRHPAFSLRVDETALAHFVRLGYVPAPHCIAQGIAKLAPGTRIEVRADRGGRIRAGEPRRYWSLERLAVSPRARPAGDEAAAVAAAERAIGDAVQERLLADVPVGALLSGGLDSSTVAALARARSGAPVRTFSIGFAERGYDESADAARIAQRLGTDHHCLRARPEDALAVVAELPEIYDEPFADSSQIPTVVVSRLARRWVTVALTGDGGDEVFGGYNRHRWAARLLALGERVPAPLRRGAGALGARIPPRIADAAGAALAGLAPRAAREPRVGEKLAKLARLLPARDERDLYLRLVSVWAAPGEALARAPESGDEPPIPQPPPGLPPAERFMFLDTVTYLPGDVLAKVDRASMSAGLEVRSPLLDPRVLELAWSLPPELKVRGAEGKWILRRVLERHVPRALFERPKAGFAVPIGSWLRGPLRGWAERLLARERLAAGGLVRPEPVHERWRAHLSGRRDEHHALWNVLMLEQWRERWLP